MEELAGATARLEARAGCRIGTGDGVADDAVLRMWLLAEERDDSRRLEAARLRDEVAALRASINAEADRRSRFEAQIADVEQEQRVRGQIQGQREREREQLRLKADEYRAQVQELAVDFDVGAHGHKALLQRRARLDDALARRAVLAERLAAHKGLSTDRQAAHQDVAEARETLRLLEQRFEHLVEQVDV